MDEDYARKLRAWLRAEPAATPRRADEEREWLREVPEPGPAADEGWQPRPGTGTADRLLAPEPGSGGRWSVRGQLPAEQPEDDDWVCPVIALPVPRPSRENGCRMSEAEARDRRSGWRRDELAQPRMSEAEARSRWNHPTNWHRRRQAEERDEGR